MTVFGSGLDCISAIGGEVDELHVLFIQPSRFHEVIHG